MNRITRSTVNEQQYSAPEFPKSGFPLSYRRYSSYMLGRLHVAGFHWVMPGDKISGRTSGEGTFHRIVTPIVSPVNAMQYNIYLPLRPLDRSFKKGMTPTKLNAMSANWTMPLCNTRYLVEHVIDYMVPLLGLDFGTGRTFFDFLDYLIDNHTATLSAIITGHNTDYGTTLTFNDVFYGYSGGIRGIIPAIRWALTDSNSYLYRDADALYCCDALLDILQKCESSLGTVTNPLSSTTLGHEFLTLFLDCVLTPFLGRYSYYGEFKYEFIRPWDIYRISHNLLPQGVPFLEKFSNTPQNEYALRAMYAVWYELFRNVDLQPVSTTLPDWQEWSSTSIFDMANGGNLCYLLYRIRPWEDDMFISSQIDDISRHVYSPVYSDSNSPGYSIGYRKFPENNKDTNVPGSGLSTADSSKPVTYDLYYVDPISGRNTGITCPVPSNINDMLAAVDKTFTEIYGLDLNTLRQSQMLEKYLKRNYLFGDEYQDRMLAHYNSKVSDMRINKPEILSRSIDGYDMGQEVSNVSTDETKVGDRTATATIKVEGEEFTTFCEEFGIVISVVSFMPRSMYDGTCPQNYLGKQVDMPLPEFATNNEEFGRKSEIAGSSLAPVGSGNDDNRYIFGRYPAYHAWRSRVDEVGGEFLDELQDSTFRRFFGMFSDDTTPKLNYFFINCRPNLSMFADTIAYNTQLYADLVNDCFVERVLPTPVETI